MDITEDVWSTDLFDTWISMGRFRIWREQFVWTDINKIQHKLVDIDDNYLANIINHLKKKLATIPDEDYDPGADELKSNALYQYVIESRIELLQQEQQFRQIANHQFESIKKKHLRDLEIGTREFIDG